MTQQTFVQRMTSAHVFSKLNMKQPASTSPDAQMMRGVIPTAGPRVGPWRADESDAPRVVCGAWHLECSHHGKIQNGGAMDAPIQHGECSRIPGDANVNVVVSRSSIAITVEAIVWPLRQSDDGAGSDVGVGHSATIFQHIACKHQAL